MSKYDNAILTDDAREEYKPTIKLMFELCPEMMARKIPEANVQQAYIFDRVKQLYSPGNSILSVGCFEDTAYESLIKSEYQVIGIDPEVNNLTLDQFYKNTDMKFNIIFSTSVIEHVRDDERFIEEICNLLKPGGYAVLTTDFRNDYTVNFPLPNTDLRFYTEYDLGNRLLSVLSRCGCSYINRPNWNGNPDFIYQGHHYSFATMIFRKDLDV